MANVRDFASRNQISCKTFKETVLITIQKHLTHKLIGEIVRLTSFVPVPSMAGGWPPGRRYLSGVDDDWARHLPHVPRELPDHLLRDHQERLLVLEVRLRLELLRRAEARLLRFHHPLSYLGSRRSQTTQFNINRNERKTQPRLRCHETRLSRHLILRLQCYILRVCDKVSSRFLFWGP